MNERLKDLMIQAGYAAPELAGRANKLAELIVQDCANFVCEEYEHEHAESIAWMMEVKFGLHGDYA